MKTATLLIFLFSFTFLSCKKDKLEGDKSMLIGKWNWSYTRYAHSYSYDSPEGIVEYLTPSNTNTNYRIEFLEKGKIIFYKNDVLIKEKRIVFKYFGVNPIGEYSVGIELDGDNEDVFSFLLIDEGIMYNTQYPFKNSTEPYENNSNYFTKE